MPTTEWEILSATLNDHPTASGTVLRIRSLPLIAPEATACAAPISVLARFDRYLVVSKPSGMAVHQTRGSTGLPLLQALRDQIGQHVYPVHRLDRGTSGAIIMALDSDAQRIWSGCFESGQVTKAYLAVVRGWPEALQTVDYALRRLDDNAVARPDGSRQPATTLLKRLSTVECAIPSGAWPTSRYALVRALPQEGRRHQIRRHLKHISHPIIGDTTYGKGLHNSVFRDHFGGRRLLLHAEQIDFQDPFDGIQRSIYAPCPEDFQSPATASGLTVPDGDQT
jgi:tRNA pseudouridine65 synthase